ncbi:DNA cytosine methyltransferase [Pontibacter mangrovi]|uniref:DNA (cytosine-5-)-methyltransferase n=1 Tax=Pontibacter mangrovi TaxID=2589816 RepID=A0A501WEH3_9BACT|nr:DNA cytosine methyltransferase [Pontibacter mangrovi]TPE43956.1 DNA cytosine methyltransferase [Pontibacter mangrovi]
MITLTDMFCGCGGSSEGAASVNGVQVKLALNHWRLAVESHNTNHPDTDHDCADISETHPARYGRTDGLIASPECTNHSLAKGQRRKNLNQGDFFQQKMIDPGAVRSRATMWDVVRFAEVHRYEFIITENVVDVRDWELWTPWLKAMHALGYNHKCVYLNAMFAHGEGITGYAPQSRDRIYIVFWKKGNPAPDLDIRPKAPCSQCGITEAVQCFKPGASKKARYKLQYIYRCWQCASEVTPFYFGAINALDLTLPMVRIKDREEHGLRPLKAKTIARIEYGIKKYGLKPLLLDQRNASGGIAARIRSAADDVLNTQSTGFSSYMFSPFHFDITQANSKGDKTRGLLDVIHTQMTKAQTALVAPPGFMPVLHGTSKVQSFADPLGCVTAGGINHSVLLSPAAVLTMRGARTLEDLSKPLPTQVAAGIQNWLVSSQPFITSNYSSNQASLATDALPTMVCKDMHALVETHGQVNVEDCYFRMLQPTETAKAQGFPDHYVILGNKEQRQKQIGNANPPPTMELLVQRCKASLEKHAWV